MGDFEETFGTGADAVDIIDRFSRQEIAENYKPISNVAGSKSEVELREIIANGGPFSDLPAISGGHGNWISKETTFADFIEVFEDTYRNGNIGDHVSDLLGYAAFRLPDATNLLRAKWCELHNINELRKGKWDLSDDCLEEKIAPIARAGIGALMMAGISGAEIKEFYGVLFRGRYT